MPKYPAAWLGAAAALFILGACDSTGPDSGPMLQVEGEVTVEGAAPNPPLEVVVAAWAHGSSSSDSVMVLTDSAGQYSAELGPFDGGAVDSVRIRPLQYDCEHQYATDVWRRDVVAGDGPIEIPPIALTYRLQPAKLFAGTSFCGVIVTPPSDNTVGDHARLAIWIDQTSDTLFGRWRIVHSAPLRDDFGLLGGRMEGDRLILVLSGTLGSGAVPVTCKELDIQAPISDSGTGTLGTAMLIANPSCPVSSSAVHFFEGATLTSIIPEPGRPGGAPQ
ncbi:MAG TPA: hypothetical protein VFL95_12555 [Gemmatimonadales bacterium]|nr:hypothetical protein [Gemmatimonadales bacterium]